MVCWDWAFIHSILGTARRMEDEIARLKAQLERVEQALRAKKDKEAAFMKKVIEDQKTHIVLNVGGVKYTTTKTTLIQFGESSMLEAMVSGRHPLKPLEDGSFFIDRDGACSHPRLLAYPHRDLLRHHPQRA